MKQYLHEGKGPSFSNVIFMCYLEDTVPELGNSISLSQMEPSSMDLPNPLLKSFLSVAITTTWGSLQNNLLPEHIFVRILIPEKHITVWLLSILRFALLLSSLLSNRDPVALVAQATAK